MMIEAETFGGPWCMYVYQCDPWRKVYDACMKTPCYPHSIGVDSAFIFAETREG